MCDMKIKVNNMKRNIMADYVYCLLRNIDFSSAIWVLYLSYKGLSLWEIGLIEGIFHITGLLFEVPSGAIADKIGRKNCMIAGRICGFLATIIELFATNFFGFAIGFVLAALGYNFNSGSEEALVYDSLKAVGEEERYIRINSRQNVIIEVAQGLATFLGGILAEYSFYWCYGAAAVIGLLNFIPLCFMTEPVMEMRKECVLGDGIETEEATAMQDEKKSRIAWKEHFQKSFSIIRDYPAVKRILLFYPVVETAYAVAFFYGQEYLSRIGCNKIEISLIMLLTGICSCIGSLCSEKMTRRFAGKTGKIVTLVLGIGIVGFSSSNLLIAVPAFALMGFSMACLYPIMSSSLNALIPSEQRATIISVESMCYSLGMIFVFPVCGLLADVIGLGTVFFVIGVGIVLYSYVFHKFPTK